MARLSLVVHPDSPSPATRIEVELARTPGGLRLDYHLFGDFNRIRLPAPQPSVRTNGLWRHGCFEAFLSGDGGYYEFNFSPSSQWAAYRFEDYRAGMRELAGVEPEVAWHVDEAGGMLTAILPLPGDARGPLGLSVIVEDIDGNRSFWALAHPPGAPDFHHAACFTAQVPPAD